MSNSLILLDEYLSKKNVKNSSDADKFEFLMLSEILKHYGLSESEIKSGIVDGSDDGGIDAFYTFVNGILIQEDLQNLVKNHAKIEVHIFTSKYSNTFILHPLESIDSSISELFDLSIESNNLTSKFNNKLIKQREIFHRVFRSLIMDCKLDVYYYYFSRGNSDEVSFEDHNIFKKSERIKSQTKKLLNVIEKCEFKFLGADELLRICTTKVNDASDLTISSSFQEDEHFVTTVNIKDFYDLITDSEGNLKQYFFDRNVRNFLGNNKTNQDILESLNDNSQGIDFWLLNNGITIIVSDVRNKTNKLLILKDVQIVNGLQTSYNIHRYVTENGLDNIKSERRSVLVKIIKTNNEHVKEKITKSTNNQTAISLYSLIHSNDTVQKDIEEILTIYQIKYNRKSNQLVDEYDDEKTVTPLILAKAYCCLVLKLPHRAYKLDESTLADNYFKFYNNGISINLWPRIIKIYQDAQDYLNDKSPIRYSRKNIEILTPIFSALAFALYLGKFGFGHGEILNFDLDNLSKLDFECISGTLEEFLRENSYNIGNLRNRSTVDKLLIYFATKYDVNGVAAFTQKKDDFLLNDIPTKIFNKIKKEYNSIEKTYSGMNIEIAKKVRCSAYTVYKAIEIIRNEDRN